jgi:hypothetical protein
VHRISEDAAPGLHYTLGCEILATRDIESGEQILLDYRKANWREHDLQVEESEEDDDEAVEFEEKQKNKLREKEAELQGLDDQSREEDEGDADSDAGDAQGTRTHSS